MPRHRCFHMLVTLIVASCSCVAQFADTIPKDQQGFRELNLKLEKTRVTTDQKITLRSFIIPATLIAYGVTSLESHDLRNLNHKVREEVYLENPHKRLPVDDYLQYAPAAAVYALNIAGIKGRNNFRDRTLIYLMSDIILNVAVSGGKSLTHELRPDASNYLSFPSGHTAHAFASAEFLRREYKDVSPWYGYAGYAVAAATGYLRMYNNRHWLSDVAAGAGVGIASTNLAYWLYPKVKQLFFKRAKTASILMPGYSNGQLGLNFVHVF